MKVGEPARPIGGRNGSNRTLQRIWVIHLAALKLLDTIEVPGGKGHQIGIVK